MWEQKRFRDLGGYAHRLPSTSAVMENYDAIADNQAFGPAAAMEYLATTTGSVNVSNLAAKIGGGASFVNLFLPPYGKNTTLQADYGIPDDFEPPYLTVSHEKDGTQKLWIGFPSGKRRDWHTALDTRPSMTLPVADPTRKP